MQLRISPLWKEIAVALLAAMLLMGSARSSYDPITFVAENNTPSTIDVFIAQRDYEGVKIGSVPPFKSYTWRLNGDVLPPFTTVRAVAHYDSVSVMSEPIVASPGDTWAFIVGTPRREQEMRKNATQ